MRTGHGGCCYGNVNTPLLARLCEVVGGQPMPGRFVMRCWIR